MLYLNDTHEITERSLAAVTRALDKANARQVNHCTAYAYAPDAEARRVIGVAANRLVTRIIRLQDWHQKVERVVRPVPCCRRWLDGVECPCNTPRYRRPRGED